MAERDNPPHPREVPYRIVAQILNAAIEPRLLWVYDEDDEWTLCCFCSKCSACMEYPGAPHNCPHDEGDNDPAAVIRRAALRTIETDRERLTAWLNCDENFLDHET